MKIVNDQEKELLGKINIYDAILLNYRYICTLIHINEQQQNRTLDSVILIAIHRLLYFCDEPMTNILLSQGPIFLSYVDRLPAQKTLTGGSRFSMKTILSLMSLCVYIFITLQFAISLLEIRIYLNRSITAFPNYDGICIVDSLVFLGDKQRNEDGVSVINPSYYTKEMGVVYKSILEGSEPMHDSIDLNNIERELKYFVSTTEQVLGRSLYKNESVVIDAELSMNQNTYGFNIIVQGKNILFIDNFTNTIVSLGDLTIGPISIYEAYKKFLSTTQIYSTGIESIQSVNISLNRNKFYVIENRDFLENTELYYEADTSMKQQVRKLFSEFQHMSYDEFWKNAMKEITNSPNIETFGEKFLKMNEETGISNRFNLVLFLALLVYTLNSQYIQNEQVKLIMNSTLIEQKGSVYNIPFKGFYPPVGKLSIGIFSHGEILVDNYGIGIENRNFPEKVTIHKQNLGSYGCISAVSHMTFLYFCYKTMNALTSLASCVDVGSFTTLVNQIMMDDQHKKLKPLTSTEGSCQLFTDKKRFYEKKYTFDGNLKYIILSYYDVETNYYKCINIVNCSVDELSKFFKGGTKFIDQFSIPRKYVTTTDLFSFIDVARMKLNITHVNILDESCNVMRATPRHGSSVCEGFALPGACVPPDKNIGWGGNSRRTGKKSRKSKKYRKK